MKFNAFIELPGQETKRFSNLERAGIEGLCEMYDVVPFELKVARTGNAWKVKTTIEDQIKYFSNHPNVAKVFHLEPAKNSGKCVCTSDS